MRVEVGRVDPGVLPIIWDDVVQIMEEYGADWLRTVDLSDVSRLLVNGEMDLWAATVGNELKGVLFASWERHAREADYHVNFIAGRYMDLWFEPGLAKLESYVALHEGTALSIGGRIGWHRLLEPRGYFPVYRARKMITQTKGVH